MTWVTNSSISGTFKCAWRKSDFKKVMDFDSSIDKQKMLNVLKADGTYVVVNYARRSVGQKKGGGTFLRWRLTIKVPILFNFRCEYGGPHELLSNVVYEDHAVAC